MLVPAPQTEKTSRPDGQPQVANGGKNRARAEQFWAVAQKTFSKCVINCYNKCTFIFRAVGAAVARPPHTRKVTGSNPVLPTI